MTLEEQFKVVDQYGGYIGPWTRIYFVNVTPALAEKWLSWNCDKQRKINVKHVEKLVRDIQNGNWKGDFVDTVVKITKNGVLINGQHRLTAIIKAGIPASLPVMFNARDDEFEYLDGGKKRFTVDFVEGKYPKTIASLSKVIMAASMTKPQKLSYALHPSLDITQIEQIKFIENNAEELEQLSAYAVKMRRIIGKGAQTLYGYFCWILEVTDMDSRLLDFIDELAMDVPNSKPVAACKNYLMRNIIIGKDSRGEYGEKFLGVLLNSYDNFVSGTSVTKVNYTSAVLSKYNKLVCEWRENQ